MLLVSLVRSPQITNDVKAAGGIKKKLFDTAIAGKMREIEAGIVRKDSFWDRLVFSKIHAKFGGRLRVCITGAAPISSEVLQFLRCIFGCFVMEGYGQTESSAAATITLPGDHEPGHVGAPFTNLEIKLADVPDMNYFNKDDKGEICFRGPGVFRGYLNDPEKTKEAIDSEGWLHSGDIGMWTPKGTLKIIDRKKHIFKLSQGEYIAPEKIENVVNRHPALMQSFVYGDSMESVLVAVIVPDPDQFPRWAAENGFSGTMADLCQNAQVVAKLVKDLAKWGAESGLKSFEMVKAVYLTNDQFTVESGLLTPTFKSKRPQLKDYYKDQIAAMYASIKARPSAE